MNGSDDTTHASGGRKRLAVTLALTYGLIAGAATAAPSAPKGSMLQQLPDLKAIKAQVSAPEGVLQRLGLPSQTYAPMANTYPVQNCDDDGVGSLRVAIDDAYDGDIVDLSGLNCFPIELMDPIVITVNNLTIKGSTDRDSNGDPVAVIDAQNVQILAPAVSPVGHSGTGVLTLQDIYLRHGSIVAMSGSGDPELKGGCVRSEGSVVLQDSVIRHCSLSDSVTSFPAVGGAIWAAGSVGLVGSTIQDSKVTNSSGGVTGGGAIFAERAVALVNSIVSDNLASSKGRAWGGGIYAGYRLIMENGTVKDNVASVTAPSGDPRGGGVYLGSPPSSNEAENNLIMGSSIVGNTALGPPGSLVGTGGGLFLALNSTKVDLIATSRIANNHAAAAGGLASNAKLALQDTIVAGNDADFYAGGLATGADVEIRRSTVARNTAKEVGGASFAGSPSQPIQIIQSTISGNKGTNSQTGAGLYLGYHTAIWNSTITDNTEYSANSTRGAGISVGDDVTLGLKSTIVSGNTHVSLANPNNVLPSDIGFAGSQSSLAQGDHNLIGNSNFLPVYFTDSILGVTDPMLEPLANNGGWTWTHLPRTTSQAYNHGAANTLTIDQRGAGYARVVAGQADIGSVERDDDRIFVDGFDYSVTPIP